MLEALAHANIGRMPTSQGYVIVEVPKDVAIETLKESNFPQDWDMENSASARAFGDQWLSEARSTLLIVPSVIAKLDRNAIINPYHPDAKKLIVSEPQKVIWDKRLFQ